MTEEPISAALPVKRMLRLAVMMATASCSADAEPAPTADMVRAERSVFLMGTLARFVALAPDRNAALDRLESMVRAVEDVEDEISTWRDDSHLARANRQAVGRALPLPAPVCGTVARAARWWRETEGAFDPAIGSLIEAWGLREGGRVPGEDELSWAKARAGLSHVALDVEQCTLTRLAEVTLDAGAFGKGAALDRVRRAVEAVPGAWLVDLGGQVAAGGGSWPVAVAHPEHRDRPALDLRLSGGSLATSGGVERDKTLESGGRVGHILDPRTGRPVVRRGSVSVWHPDALAADALSTALQVMGPEEGLRWAVKRGIAACFLLPNDRPGGAVTVVPTPEFHRRFLSANGV